MKVLTYDSNVSNRVRRSVLMKNTKITALAAGMGSLVFATAATADISVELVSNGDDGYGHVYGLYVVGLDWSAGDRIDAVYGNADSVLNIEASTSFYQNPLGGPTSRHINPAFYSLFPSIMSDSWVTIGYADMFDNNLNYIGIDFTSFNQSGGALTTDNGSWFVTPDDPQGSPGSLGTVLIGQFTVVNGTGVAADVFVSAIVNIQGTVNGELYNGIGMNAIPAPGALALLGLAGVTARRRRK